MTEIIDLACQMNEPTKRQTSVIHEMASLQESERVKFWREQQRVARQGTSPGGRVQ